MTTIFPAGDSFDQGSPGFDTGGLPGFYVRAIGWLTDPAYGSGGTGYNQGWAATGQMYVQSRQRLEPVPVTETEPSTRSIRGAISTTTTPVVGNSAPTAWLWRDLDNGQVALRLTFSLWSSALLGASRSFFVGVCARANSGSVFFPGSSTAYMRMDAAYWFGVISSTLSGPKYVLLRIVGSVVTRLAETPAGNGITIPWSTWYANNAAKTLRFHVQQMSGPDRVLLVGYVDDVATLTFTDSSGSRLANSGRVGFAMSNEVWQMGTWHAPQAHRFDVRNADGQVLVYDEFDRADLRMAARITSSVPAELPGGFDAASCFAGDWRSVSTYRGRIGVASIGTGTLAFYSASLDHTGFYLSQRLANDPRTQDRQAAFQFQSVAPGVAGLVRGFGIVVRGTSGRTVGQLASGYMAEVAYDQDAALWRLYLYRFIGTAGTLIAQRLTGVNGALGAFFTLRVRVETPAVPDPINGYPRVRVFFEGTQMELSGVGAPGVTFDAGGTVTDASSDRVLAGNCEGFYLRTLLGSQARIYVDAWAQGEGIVPGGGGENDHASIPVPDEAAGAFGAFPVPYDWGDQQDRGRAVYSHELDSDHRFIGTRHSRDRRSWRIGAKSATQQEIDALRSFFDSHKGIEIPFTFQPPGRHAVPVTARLTSDTLAIAQLFPGVYSWNAEVEEVLSGA